MPALLLFVRWGGHPAPVPQTSTRLETLGEVYEHQVGLIKKLSKDVARLRNVRDDTEERLEAIKNVAEEQRVSGWHFRLSPPARYVSSSPSCVCLAGGTHT